MELTPYIACHHFGNMPGSKRCLHIISWTQLKRFAESHAQADRPLRVWRSVMRKARLVNHQELQAVWPQVRALDARRVVFRIGGHKFRLVVDMRYDLGRIYVRWIGTHEEYNSIRAEEA